MKASQIAEYMLALDRDMSGNGIDNLKLNTLLYFAQGQALATIGRPLFDDSIEAWNNGPVVPAVYFKYKSKGGKNIRTKKELDLSMDPNIVSIIVDVVSSYDSKPSLHLMHMAGKKGSPYYNAKNKSYNQRLDLDEMKTYFKENRVKSTLELIEGMSQKHKIIKIHTDSNGNMILPEGESMEDWED